MGKYRSFTDGLPNWPYRPEWTFKVGPMNGRDALESGLLLKGSLRQELLLAAQCQSDSVDRCLISVLYLRIYRVATHNTHATSK